MMRRLATVLICLLVLIGAAVAIWKFNYLTYTYRYRLTLAIEVDGRVHNGSSVIEVAWVGHPYISNVGSFKPHVRGQATFIDLGAQRAVIATLTAPSYNENGFIRWPYGVAPLFLAARAFGNKSTYEELPELPRLRGRRDLTADNMAPLLWLPDVAEPKSARRLKVEEIPAVFGPNARLAAAYVEITSDPLVIDIDRKLPWYSEMAKRQKAVGVFARPDEFVLTYTMFIGDGS